VTSRPYWQLRYAPAATPPDEQEAIERVEDLLRQAVRRRLMSEVPLGAFLSGGLDSSTVVALMAEASSRPVRTFSIGFEEQDYSELQDARRVAEHLGTDHHELIVKPSALDVLPELVWHLDEPFGDSSAVPTWEVSRLAREKVTVALSGDGGDELFGGYRRHVLEGWEHTARAAGGAAARALGRLARALPRSVGGRNTLARLAAAPARACAEKFQFGAGARALKAIYTRELRAALAGADPLAPFARAYARAAGADPLNRILYVDLKTYLPDDILVKVDRMSMAHGLEVRAPFLDHRLVELVAALPGPVKVRARGAKPLLRTPLARRVPREAWDRPKHGFTAPIGSWLRRELREGVEACLFAPASLGRELFERAALRRLWQTHLDGADHAHELWMLLMLELWHRGAA
jgi:asparagine synthase (glutamine-hydrolysing)